MKKHLIKFVSILLVFVLTLLSLASCELSFNETDDIKDGAPTLHYLFPDGYTGGFRNGSGYPHCYVEYWWVETYEECIDAIKLLRSHDSSFSSEIYLGYDGDLFDVKYCFQIDASGSKTQKIKWGDNPFDRYADTVKLGVYVFFEEVTIDEINHSDIGRYNAYRIRIANTFKDLHGKIDVSEFRIGDWNPQFDGEERLGYYVNVEYDGELLMSQSEVMMQVRSEFYTTGDDIKINEECIRELLTSGKIIDPNREE